jgi:hypothetical protein
MKSILLSLFAVLLLCTSCKYFKKSSPESFDTLVADTLPAEGAIDSAALNNNVVRINETQAQQSQLASQHVSPSMAVGGRYYMIVGCFTVQRNTDKYVEKLKGMGYNPQVISGGNNFQMVAAKSYNNYRESVSEIDKFRNDVTPNAWVYRQR